MLIIERLEDRDCPSGVGVFDSLVQRGAVLSGDPPSIAKITIVSPTYSYATWEIPVDGRHLVTWSIDGGAWEQPSWDSTKDPVGTKNPQLDGVARGLLSLVVPELPKFELPDNRQVVKVSDAYWVTTWLDAQSRHWGSWSVDGNVWQSPSEIV